MNTRQIIITALLIIGCIALSAWLFSSPTPVEDNDLRAHRQFIVSQLGPASALENALGIPMSVPITIAAMTSEFGENDEITPANAFFLLQVDSTSKTDTIFIGEVPLRAYHSTSRAYADWAKALMQQDFYPLVKGQPIEKWFPHLEKWGYGIEDMYNNFPELQQVDSIFIKH